MKFKVVAAVAVLLAAVSVASGDSLTITGVGGNNMGEQTFPLPFHRPDHRKELTANLR